MEIQDGQMTFEEMQKIQSGLLITEFQSNLNCFMSHAGIRRAEVSTIIGPYGNGKSTFVRTLVSELLYHKRKVLLILSEEKIKMYKMPLWRIAFEMTNSEDLANDTMRNLFIATELDSKKDDKNIDSFMDSIKKIIPEKAIDVVIIDNFTTSFLGNSPIWIQAIAIGEFKQLAVKYNLPIFSVFHTAKGVDIYNKIATGEDVRGNATSANVGSYNYVVMTFFRLPIPRAFVCIDKARYHDKSNKTVYELEFNSTLGIYTGDKKSSYDEIQRVLNQVKENAKKVDA